MKTKYVFLVSVLALLAAQVSFAGSIKGKVSPGKSVVYLESATPVARHDRQDCHHGPERPDFPTPCDGDSVWHNRGIPEQ